MTYRSRLWTLALVSVSLVAPGLAQSGGEATYKSKCAMCHGADGLATSPMAKAMSVPSVKSEMFTKLSESEMVTATTNGKGKMPAYKGKLSDAEVKEAVAYMRGLEKK
ncbi:MAG TPA: cytochrome c [Acidobacteriaceae bacterium]|nr:cytochrome c [Acidobacteriaceae bacterium]